MPATTPTTARAATAAPSTTASPCGCRPADCRLAATLATLDVAERVAAAAKEKLHRELAHPGSVWSCDGCRRIDDECVCFGAMCKALVSAEALASVLSHEARAWTPIQRAEARRVAAAPALQSCVEAYRDPRFMLALGELVDTLQSAEPRGRDVDGPSDRGVCP